MTSQAGTSAGTPLLDAGSVAAYLRSRGVLPPAAPADVEELGGGVSSTVLRVRSGAAEVVVKQALPVLRVSQHWPADPARAGAEAAALRLAGASTPDAVPRVLDEDAERHVLVLEAAPRDWRTWKADLLGGRVDAGVAGVVGELAGTWHARTRAPDAVPAVPAVLADGVRFEQLRLEPYLRRTAGRLPELAGPLLEVAGELAAARTCLVHGDLSPKNVLVGDAAGGDDPHPPWVLDFEVAHLGDPAFDVAFLATHLLLKAVHLPAAGPMLHQAAEAFVAAHRRAAPELAPPPGGWLRIAGALVLARVHGASPVEYLDATGRAHADRLGRGLLLAPPASLDAAWSRLEALR
jgi:hypothetical protein